MRMPWRSAATAVTLGLVLFFARPVQAQDDSLSFFKNYFITGGYEVGGVGLVGQGVDGVAQGAIAISGVPDGAEIVAAFLYAQVVSADGADAGGAGVTFHGVPLSTSEGTFGAVADPLGATPCWSSGGGTGQSGGSKRTYSYRYDVLRLLPVVSGRHDVNRDHPVALPDNGNNKTPIALGASLVVIYRDPDMPLSAFVLYDGTWAMDNATEGMTQTIEGFYDAGSIDPATNLPVPVVGELTHIVGSGQANKKENLRVNGNIVAVNPFRSFEGDAWDNVTIAIPDLLNVGVLTTSVDHAGFNSFDCLTWSAVIFRTEVKDWDEDGLLDIWEEDNVVPLLDPHGQPLPNLHAMGARKDHKDLFVEVGYMHTNGAALFYGTEQKPAHTHLPTAAALLKVGDAYAAAPQLNPDGSFFNPDMTGGVNVHVDVGANYQSAEADPYVIPVADGARGGESLGEPVTVCVPGPDDPPFVCQFSLYPGTVAWKSSYRAIRDALLNDPDPDAAPEDDHICDTPANPGYDDGIGGNCERVFDRNRKDMFRYMFFAHAVGVPKAHCLDLSGDPDTNPNFGLPDPVCQVGDANAIPPIPADPNFHVPNTYTGIGDWGGADAMVTMGGFDNAAGLPVGTDNQQAGTIMHELGHTMMLTHGGAPGNANCGPNRLSVMNYMFQLRGLRLLNGGLTVDYSGQTIGDLNESDLSEMAGLTNLVNVPAGTPPYGTSWYAPFAGIGTQATRHCNGTPIAPGEPAVVRVDGTDVGFGVDWNTDGDLFDSAFALDLNFDGSINDGFPGDGSVDPPVPPRPILTGYNDWAKLRLNQVGSRRNIGIWYFADEFPYIGPASLDMGRFDFGRFDFGRFDFGRFDFGRFDFGDLNTGDLGRFDFGRFDFGRFDFGRFDFGVGAGDLGRGSDGKGGFGRFDFGRFDFGGGADGELTIDVAVAAGLLGPPTDFTACVDPDDPACDDGDPSNQDPGVVLAWRAPDASPLTYLVYRSEDGGATFVLVGTVDPASGVDGAFAFVDAPVDRGTTYTYYAAARYQAGIEVNESASDTADVTVTDIDIIAPVIAPHGPVSAEATGPGGASVIFASPATTDNVDPDGVASCGPASGSLFALGDTTVTCSATDVAGNDAVPTTFTVTVEDTTAPGLSQPADVVAEATSASGAAVTFALPVATDAVDPNPTVVCGPASGATFALGTTQVTCTATDTALNTFDVFFDVTVEDTTAPGLSQPADVVAEATSGSGAAVTFALPVATDAVDPNPTVVCGPASGATFVLGTTQVTCTATDTALNTFDVFFDATVEDTTAPGLSQPADVGAEATSASGAVVTFALPVATDAVDPNPTVVCGPASGATFVLGTTQVTCTATDAALNTIDVFFDVTVVDTTAPVVTAPASITAEAEGALTSATTALIAAFLGSGTAVDIVDGDLTGAISTNAPVDFPLGATVVTFSAADGAVPPNNGSAVATVTIIDTTPPVIAAHGDVTAEAMGPGGAIVSYASPSTADIVDPAGVASCAPASGSLFARGNTTVTCIATDVAGNAAAPTTFTISVVDTIPPTIATNDDLAVDATSASGTVVTFALPAASDVVGVLSVACVPPSGSVFPFGATVVTCTATDLSGLSGQSTFTVTVTPPTLTLVMDDEGIGGGSAPNFFSDADVAADVAQIGLRTQLPFFADNVGTTITLPSGVVGDEGWFAVETMSRRFPRPGRAQAPRQMAYETSWAIRALPSRTTLDPVWGRLMPTAIARPF